MNRQELSPRERAASLGAVIAATFGVGLYMGIGFPLIALRLEHWGVSGTLIGLNGAMMALGVLVLGPFMARIARALGALPTMLYGITVGAAALAAMPFVPNLGAWFVLRFFTGVGLALPWLVGETWINAVVRDAMRARVIGIYSASLFAGMALGPQLLQVTGTAGVLPFLAGGGALVLAAAPLIAAWRLSPDISAAPRLRLGQAILSAPTVAGAALLAGSSESAFYMLLPVYGLRAGLPEGAALTLLTVLIVGAIVMQYPLGWLADRVDRRRLLVAMAASFAVLAPALAPAITAPMLAWPLLMILGGLALGYYTVGLALLGTRFGPGELAVANAAFIVLYEMGTMIGPAVAGGAMDLWEPHGYVAALAMFAAVFAALVLVRRATPGNVS